MAVKIKVKRLTENAEIPVVGTERSTGFDLVATSKKRIANETITYGTGIAIEIPSSHTGYLFPRSSIHRMDLRLCNAVGVIDPDYRGELLLKYDLIRQRDSSGEKYFSINPNRVYNVGDKIAQLVILPTPQVVMVEEETLSNTDRSMGGFGSTDIITSRS